MKTRSLKAAAALLALAGLTLAGVAEAKEKITFAYQLDPMFEASMWALKTGKVTSGLIDVELSVLPIPALIQATPTKQYDVIQGDTIAVARLAERGLKLVIMSTAIRYNPKGQGHHLWTKADSPYQTPQDLKGKRVAVPSLGAAGVHLMRYALAEKYGLDVSVPGGDLLFVETPVPAMIAGLHAEQFEAASLIYTQNYQATKDPALRVIAQPAHDMYEMWGLQMVPSVNLGYPEKIAERPEAFKEFARLLRDSVLYMQNNREEVYSAVAAAQKVDPDFFPTVFSSYSEFPANLTANDRKAILKLWELAHQHGALPVVPPLEDFIYEHAVTEE
jgi:NitT/TauT family transport system substrate-binding protein